MADGCRLMGDGQRLGNRRAIGSSRRPLRVGIWCAYGTTLEPRDGIGVFAHHLARALAEDDRVAAVVLVVHAGQEDRVAATVEAGRGRIRAVAIGPLPWLAHCRWKLLRRRHRRLSDAIARGAAGRLERQRARIEKAIVGLHESRPVRDREAFAACDVWMLPHVGVEHRLPGATVVVVHDMVPLHFPGVVKAGDLESFRRRAQAIVTESTLVGTLSRTIRDVDIVGLLGCPVGKVRVVPPAIPDDFGAAAELDAVRNRWPFISRPFVLYPAAFRPYKNHAALVEALAELRRRGDRETQVVFTGDVGIPPALAHAIDSHRLADRVHVVGPVERHVLARLYCEALATIVPSRYEQGSFPILESLHWGCPVAASDIPALREALAGLGATMIFFDPEKPVEIADAIRMIADDQQGVQRRQAHAFDAVRGRGWRHVANDWLEVFEEAVAVHSATASGR